MRRRLLDLCLLTYPVATRRRDRDYLRDLALDLADQEGLGRQVVSLLCGGLRERRVSGRRRALAVVAAVAVALAAVASGAVLLPASAAEETTSYTCEVVGAADGCATGAAELRARQHTGWHCTTRQAARTDDAETRLSWSCHRSSGAS